jgi:molybdopterin-guanine dinucleotide biosynthesis protein A
MITVSIQAGGRSSRMGENKALKKFKGAPLIQRVIDRVRPIADEIIILSGQPDLFEFLGIPIYPDRVQGFGVLGGIYTALSISKLSYVAPVGCDMPFISAALLAAEIAELESGNADVVIPESSNGLEPLHAVYRRETCLVPVENAISSGDLRIVSWFDQVKVRIFTIAEIQKIDPSPNIFMNVNTPEDFQRAERIASI